MSFERYSETHRHFLSDELPPLLERVARPGVIADLGCGDGALLYALERRGLLEGGYAVDLSPIRVRRAVTVAPRLEGRVADATASGLPNESADGVVVSQVIEHLPDDRLLAPEISRILKPGGWFYVGSVARKRWGWWIYRRDGRWWLDPTHVREYRDAGALVDVLRNDELVIRDVVAHPQSFPALDLALRAAAAVRAGPADLSLAYVRHARLRRLRRIRLPVPGYSVIEVAGEHALRTRAQT